MFARSRVGIVLLSVSLLCHAPQAFAAVTVTTVDSIGDVGFSTSLTINADGFPIIAHYDENQSYLVVVDCGNAACSSGNTITDVDTSGNALVNDIEIALGGDNLAVIGYFHYPYPTVLHCGNATCTSGNVITNVDDTGVGGEGEEIDLAIGADGFPVLSVTEASFNNNTVGAFRCENATCTSQWSFGHVQWDAQEDIDASGVDTAIARIGTNLVIVADVEDIFNVTNVFTCVPNNECGIDTETIHASVGGFYDAVAGADGFPVITLQQGANIRVADCSTANCSSVTVTTIATDAITSVGEHTSIALGDDGMPIVSYYGGSNDLKVIHCGNATCSTGNTTSTVDSTGSVGHYSSIDIGGNGMPVISYFDDTNNDLKVAACDNVRCDASGPDPVPFIPWWAMGPMVLAAGAMMWRNGRLQPSDIRIQ